MKKIIRTLVLTLASIALLASCSDKDKYGTHEFFLNVRKNVASSERADAIAAIINKDPYFSKKISYTGKFSEVCSEAINEFRTHCEALDAEAIEAQLEPLEYYRIDFWSCDPADNWISCIFTGNSLSLEE